MLAGLLVGFWVTDATMEAGRLRIVAADGRVHHIDLETARLAGLGALTVRAGTPSFLATKRRACREGLPVRIIDAFVMRRIAPTLFFAPKSSAPMRTLRMAAQCQ